MRITLEDVRRALALEGFDPLLAQARMAPRPRAVHRPEIPGTAKLAGVLVLLFPAEDDEALHFALMKRTEYPGVHSGQISLPGGRREGDETFIATALRETEEELGANADSVEIVGSLTPLYVPPSDFEIHPAVGYTPTRPVWIPDPNEVAEILEVSAALLLDDSYKGFEFLERGDVKIEIGYYRVGEHKVWGATAAMLSEFEMRLRIALDCATDAYFLADQP